jgi:hypothetical protein
MDMGIVDLGPQLVENLFLPTNDDEVIFNSPAFFELHKKNRAFYFQWVEDDKVLAVIHVTEITPGFWRSPARGTFSGYSFGKNVGLQALFNFHTAVCDRLKDFGAEKLEILLPPEAHDPVVFAKQFYMLNSTSFSVSDCNLNYSISIDGNPLVDRMTYGNQKRFRKCERAHLTARKLTETSLGEVYELLKENRASKGHQISMTLHQLEEMRILFPNEFLLFGVFDGERLAAAAVCLRIKNNILYVFYWGDSFGYASFSPVVQLAAEIYTFCQSEGVEIMDIGTSTEGSLPNFGLINFKKGLGFSESLKVSMIKNLLHI